MIQAQPPARIAVSVLSPMANPSIEETYEATAGRPSWSMGGSAVVSALQPHNDHLLCPAGTTLTRRPHLGFRRACSISSLASWRDAGSMFAPVVFLIMPVTLLFAFFPGVVGLNLLAP